MKVSADDYAAIAAAVEPLDTEEARNLYRGGQFPRADAVKDLDKRYRWDLFWRGSCFALVADSGYADAHLDTALRKIVPPLS